MARGLKRAGLGLAGALLLGLVLFIVAVPLPDRLNRPDYAKVLLAEDGTLLAASIAADQQWRFPQPGALPEKYVVAVTQFEDQYFFQHIGVNPVALIRALWGNLRSGRVVSGGSTITMQLARIARGDPPRTYSNKLLEIALALKLEWRYSKQEILHLYAGNAPFGGNTVGISAASWRYFGRNLQGGVPQSLSWAEAALLAVLPNSPALIHPGRGRDKLLAKRDRLLAKLHQHQQLSDTDFQLSLLEPLPDKPHPIPQLATHLLHTLVQRDPALNQLSTTLDGALQKKVNAMASRSGRQLAAQGVHNISALVIDNQQLVTRAYIGNITHGDDPSSFAPALDIAQRPRSTGSILKPLLYGFMLQAGAILPDTLVADIPSNFGGFTPENYDHLYRGAVPAHQALAQSLNIPAVRLLKAYGYPRFYDDLRQLGMSTLFRSADDYGLSLILGGAEGNLWEITGIYARLVHMARSGFDGKVNLLQAEVTAPRQRLAPLNQGAAYLTLDALLEVARPGTEQVWREFSSSQKIAWKTGTSYGLRDAWAVGSNGRYTVGIWAGNAGGEGIAGLSGVKTAAPLLFQIFDLLGQSQWLDEPQLALKPMRTCRDDGFLATDKCPSKITLAPSTSHFQQVSPYHQTIQLDASAHYRVHGGCEKVANMVIVSRMVLPPIQEYYWKKHHSEYQTLPPWRADCVADLANYTDDMPMDIIYPQDGAKIYIPNELSGQRGRVIFKASHRDFKAKLFWHIDNHFIQQTDVFHDITLDLKAGWHQLILVDELGFRLQRWFKVVD